MLSELSIRDVALISRLHLSFRPGLNVLSGETGAGKSLIVGSLRLLGGEKAPPDVIREGENRAYLQATFELDPKGWIAQEMIAAGIPLDDGELVVSREFVAQGQGKIRVNGVTVARSQWSDLSSMLVDLHGQHDQQRLLSAQEQRSSLDAFAGLTEDVDRFGAAFQEWRRTHQELEELRRTLRDSRDRRDLVRFQVEEISRIEPKAGEVSRLESEQARLEAADFLRRTADEIVDRVLEGENAIHDVIARLCGKAEEASRQAAEWRPLAESLESMRVQAQEVGREARAISRETVEDPERLDAVRNRLRKLAELLRKYGPTEAELFARWESLKRENQDPAQREREAEVLEKRLQEISATLATLGKTLTKSRKLHARKLSSAMEKALEPLGMSRARFDIRFTALGNGLPWSETSEGILVGPSGFDDVEFLFSANPGESPKALGKIASGGETSRVMLALKTILGRIREPATMVFDEVDAGIGGVVAGRVGEAMETLAKDRQILCITHLPQVASRATHHLVVSKREDEGRTVSEVTIVEGEERVREIARMFGDDSPRGVALDHARSLLRGVAA